MENSGFGLSPQPVQEEPLEPLLRSIFLKFSQPWVWDYIMNPDGASDTAILTSPSNVQHAVVSNMRNYARAFADFGGFTAGDFCSTAIGVPAFYVDGIAVGTVAAEFIDEAGVLWPAEKTQRVFRFAHHIETGVSISVLISAEDDFVSVLTNNYISAAMRRRTLLQFAKEPFVKTMKNVPLVGIDTAALVNCLTWSSIAREYRQCPVCGSPSSTWCGCKLECETPRHALDFERVSRNYTRFFGDYTGKFSVNSLSEGKRVTMSRDAHCSVENVATDGVGSKLLEWGIKNRIQNSAIRLGACEVPFVTSARRTKRPRRLLENWKSPCVSEEADNAKQILFSTLSDDDEITLDLSNASKSADVQEFEEPTCSESSWLQPEQVTETMFFDTGILGQLCGADLNAVRVLPGQSNEVAVEQEMTKRSSEVHPLLEKEKDNADLEESISWEQDVGEIDATTHLQNNFGCDGQSHSIVTNSIPGSSSISASSRSDFVPIAPLPTSEAEDARRAKIIAEEERRMEERRLARKMRNREAAARSNLKRKLRNEAKKREKNSSESAS